MNEEKAGREKAESGWKKTKEHQSKLLAEKGADYPNLPHPVLPHPNTTLPYPTVPDPTPTQPYPTALPHRTPPYPALPYPTSPYPAQTRCPIIPYFPASHPHLPSHPSPPESHRYKSALGVFRPAQPPHPKGSQNYEFP